MRRWCDHIQSDQLTKTRYFGGWCCRRRTTYLAQCHELLGVSAEKKSTNQAASANSVVVDEPSSLNHEALPSDSSAELKRLCPECERGRLRLIGSTPKPSWSSVLNHLDARCPSWFAETEYEEFCAHLEGEYGISYKDWYLEMRIESTMRGGPMRGGPISGGGRTLVPHQLYLPGLSPERDFLLDSF